jgi:hypothetical protein
MEIALAVLAVWLLGNVVGVLAWALHRGAPTRTPVARPSVAVPGPRPLGRRAGRGPSDRAHRLSRRPSGEYSRLAPLRA